MVYVEVILPLPLEGIFTYAASDALAEKVKFGVRVLVPLGKTKTYTGLVVRQHHNQPDFEVKEILAVLDGQPILLPTQYKLWQWMADYYMSPLGEIFKAALPSGLKAEDGFRPKTETCIELAPAFQSEQALHIALDMLRRAPKQQKVLEDYLYLCGVWNEECGMRNEERGERREVRVGSREERGEEREITREELMNESHCTAAVMKQLVDRGILQVYEREVGRLNHGGEPHPEHIKPLNVAQQDAYNQILFQMMRKNVVLLHGVTSSGKTEIYIHLIQKTIDEGRQVLYLLPEIALTVQMMERLRAVFGNRLGIYHSKYSDAERVEVWQKQLSKNPYDVILGARSAVFLPFQRLGLVIVDEEHETSFKQQDPMPRYHARSAAIMLAELSRSQQIPSSTYPKVLLGTATPSMESYYNAQHGKYGLVELKTRYQDIALPEVEVVDVKDLYRRKMMSGPFSPRLLGAVREALAAGKQAILFQNRRGFAPMVECKVCGWVPHCQNCDVSLTLHKNLNQLTCHYCGYTYTVPTECPCCGSTELRGKGYGTEKIEDYIRDVFPEARVARMDLDTTRTRNAYERLIGDFSSGRTNVLIGTQMISKGLDFDRVSVVGILDADSMLNYPDFRAYEQAFTMMSQVAGRAGRKGQRGLVLLQTKNKELPVIQQVVANDFSAFYQDMLEERRMFNYPPFCHLVYVYLRHRYEDVVDSGAVYMGGLLRRWFGKRVLGPDKPAVAKVKTLHIRKIVLKLENGIDQNKVRAFLRQAEKSVMEEKRYASLQVYYDVDPL
ncbi:MAG: primosomal protein N' [Prevotella sp.]|nr:primosomal protein N' [Prevotella sp.]